MVVNNEPGNVIVFNADSDTVVGSVALTEFGTDDCSILDDQSLGFVNDFGPQQVWVIDPSVPSLAAGINPIPVSEASEDLTISADQQFLLNTGGFTDSRVSVIDIANRMEIHSFDVGNSAESVEACSDNSVLTSGVVDLPPRTSPPSKLDSEPFEVHSTG